MSQQYFSSQQECFKSEFEQFIQTQISGLILTEKKENSLLNREQELIISIDFCKRFLIENVKNCEREEEGESDDLEKRRSQVLAKLVELKLELETYKVFL
jgi:hypothetical protein